MFFIEYLYIDLHALQTYSRKKLHYTTSMSRKSLLFYIIPEKNGLSSRIININFIEINMMCSELYYAHN